MIPVYIHKSSFYVESKKYKIYFFFNQHKKNNHVSSCEIKGLSAWMNSYLQSANIPKIENLEKDLQNGVKLNQFLTVVSEKKLTFDLTPNMKIHRIQNLSTAIEFIQNTLGVRLVGISAEGKTCSFSLVPLLLV